MAKSFSVLARGNGARSASKPMLLRVALGAALVATTLISPIAQGADSKGGATGVPCAKSPRVGVNPLPRRAIPGSLPSGNPRPGPAVLHWAAPRAPQLENTDGWRAAPTMVSGSSAYRKGEYLYQDYLYDDTALSYPDEPAVYAGNAADLVEIRLRKDGSDLLFRLTYNTMIDPSRVATTIALGSSSAPVDMPYGAGARLPAQAFITAHGCDAELQHAGRAHRLALSVDPLRRQVSIRVPQAAFDTRGRTALRLAAATGLWDVDAEKYQRPDATKPAFFNVAFRFAEPHVGMSDSQQNTALAQGDLSSFFTVVDLKKLARGTTDDMVGAPRGVPRTGVITRIYASHFETNQGRGTFGTLAYDGKLGYTPCNAPCSPPLAGRLQPYSIVVPNRPRPHDGWGLTIFHHGTTEDYQSFQARATRFSELDGNRSIALLPETRGPNIWEFDEGAADLYEAWADLARIQHLDPSRVVLSGQSLGGYAVWKNAVMFPDLWAAINPTIGPVAPEVPYTAALPALYGEQNVLLDLIPSLRHVPVVYWVGLLDKDVPYAGTSAAADRLAAAGYRFELRGYATDHAGVGLRLADYDDQGRYLAGRRVTRDPARISFAYRSSLQQPRYGVAADHAYWLSGLRLATTAVADTGSVDAISGALRPDGPPSPVRESIGVHALNIGGAPLPYLRKELEWGQTRDDFVPRDQLTLVVEGIRSLNIDVRRAHLSCSPQIKVQTDTAMTVSLVGCGRTLRFEPNS